MSLDATRWAWRQQGVTSSEKLVLLALADRADERSRCFPSARRLCEDTCLNRKTVLAVLGSLIEKGLLEDTGHRIGNGVRVFRLTGVEHREDALTHPNIGTGTGTKNGTGSECASGSAEGGTHPKNGTGTDIGTGTKNGTATHPNIGTATHPNIGTLNLPGNLSENRSTDGHTDTLPGVPRAPDGPLPCPHQKIIDLYHEVLPELKRVRRWEGSRREHLQARWRDRPKRQNLDWWRKFFEAIRQSDWLMGRVPSSNPDRAPFRADLPWMVKRENFIKIMDRKYHDA